MSEPQAQTASDLPTGTVTFVFSDIEGSTRLVQALGADYPPVLAASRSLIAEAVAAHAGSIFGYEGDAVFMAFGSPAAAVHAAVEAQRAIESHEWPAAQPVRVRMGIHTGEALLVGNDYVGLALHAAARITSAANGGQILLSEATRSLLQPTALSPLALRDMGKPRSRLCPILATPSSRPRAGCAATTRLPPAPRSRTRGPGVSCRTTSSAGLASSRRWPPAPRHGRSRPGQLPDIRRSRGARGRSKAHGIVRRRVRRPYRHCFAPRGAPPEVH